MHQSQIHAFGCTRHVVSTHILNLQSPVRPACMMRPVSVSLANISCFNLPKKTESTGNLSDRQNVYPQCSSVHRESIVPARLADWLLV
jgi:hypothetical protein